MLTPDKIWLFAGLMLIAPAMAEDTSEMDFFLFLAEFTDNQGNWDAPAIEEEEDTTEPVELMNE